MTVFIGVIMVVSVAAVIALPLIRLGDTRGPTQLNDRTERLRREKTVALMAIREADFDRATGKLTDDDYSILRQDYEQRALGALSQLDRDAIHPTADVSTAAEPSQDTQLAAFCGRCGTPFGEADRFCASCGGQRMRLGSRPSQASPNEIASR